MEETLLNTEFFRHGLTLYRKISDTDPRFREDKLTQINTVLGKQRGLKAHPTKTNMNRIKQYESNSDFLEFLNSEFDKTAVNATVEELAEFAFGSLKEAIKAFEKGRNNES